jgi:hypothetical protein
VVRWVNAGDATTAGGIMDIKLEQQQQELSIVIKSSDSPKTGAVDISSGASRWKTSGAVSLLFSGDALGHLLVLFQLRAVHQFWIQDRMCLFQLVIRLMLL